MPKPRKNESKNDFMKRCVPQVMDEGKPQAQAIAVCSSLWENRNKSAKDLDNVRKR